MTMEPSSSDETTRRRRRRRRPRPTTTAATGALPLALLLSSALADQSPHEINEPNEATEDGRRHLRSPSFQRRLRSQKSETLTKWRSLSTHDEYDYNTHLRPLDLVLDETDQTHHRVYQRGASGFLEPYDFDDYQDHVGSIDLGAFAANERGLDGSSSNSNADGGTGGGGHHSSGRMGLTNFDLNRGIGLDGEVEDEERRERNLRGINVSAVDASPSEEAGPAAGVIDHGQPFFRYTEENDPEELEDYEIMDDEFLSRPWPDAANAEAEADRRLQGGDYGYGHAKSSETSSARGFSVYEDSDATSASSTATTTTTSTSSSAANSISQNGARQNPSNSHGGDRTPPSIRATFPPKDTSIGPHQTFGALVEDEESGVKKCCVQFKDHTRARSSCFDLSNVGASNADGGTKGGKQTNSRNRGRNDVPLKQKEQSQVWELTFEGFHLFAGKRWQYRVRCTDGARNKRSSSWRTFVIDPRAGDGGDIGSGGGDRETTTTSTAAPDNSRAPPAPAEKLTELVKDSDWPHGGVVQTTTGRIMFFFDGHPYVCTGTVVKNPKRDRTIVLTAGHCAYQYRSSGGRFAEKALFIPNQRDTRARKSNDVCSDDPLGCWMPAYAVVDYEWTRRKFPQSVPWDIAYYVIPNDPGAHEGGFVHERQKGLSKILEEVVEPLPVDFDWRIDNSRGAHSNVPGELAHGLGYSFDRDPDFRYCSSRMSTKFGISTYENLWLGTCEMSGGSSGGPWLIDADKEGRGTVVSINSWGYSSTPGMGGPNFATSAGGIAECLFEVAMKTRFEDLDEGQMGVVAENCR